MPFSHTCTACPTEARTSADSLEAVLSHIRLDHPTVTDAARYIDSRFERMNVALGHATRTISRCRACGTQLETGAEFCGRCDHAH